MKTMPTLSLENPTKSLSWAEVVLYLSGKQKPNIKRLKEWSDIFQKVTVLAPAFLQKPEGVDVCWIAKNPGQYKADAWNMQLAKSEAEWVLFLEEGEDIQFLDFPHNEEINANCWPPALMKWHERDVEVQFYQMRFIPGSARDVFGGRELPDCTRYVIENKVQVSNAHIQVDRKESPVIQIDSAMELGIQDFAPQVYLVEGQRYLREKEYVYATAQFRQLLKRERLLPFDRLGAVNGIASCLAEQYKWQKALNVAQQSLEAEPFQNLPYLIKYRIFSLQQRWLEAYDALGEYYGRIDLQSAANFDVILSEEETLVNLSDLALKARKRSRASEHLDELFAIKNGDVDQNFLKKILLLCTELGDLKKAKFYFGKRFGKMISNKELDEQDRAELNDFTTLFMKNEWFELVHDIYEDLHEMYPEDDDFKRRLIVTSVKTNRIEQARNLATKVA